MAFHSFYHYLHLQRIHVVVTPLKAIVFAEIFSNHMRVDIILSFTPSGNKQFPVWRTLVLRRIRSPCLVSPKIAQLF